jgi:hypothetical protein
MPFAADSLIETIQKQLDFKWEVSQVAARNKQRATHSFFLLFSHCPCPASHTHTHTHTHTHIHTHTHTFQAYNLLEFCHHFSREISEDVDPDGDDIRVFFPIVSTKLLADAVLVESWAPGHTISSMCVVEIPAFMIVGRGV